jgi:hypothetical protein
MLLLTGMVLAGGASVEVLREWDSCRERRAERESFEA